MATSYKLESGEIITINDCHPTLASIMAAVILTGKGKRITDIRSECCSAPTTDDGFCKECRDRAVGEEVEL